VRTTQKSGFEKKWKSPTTKSQNSISLKKTDSGTRLECLGEACRRSAGDCLQLNLEAQRRFHPDQEVVLRFGSQIFAVNKFNAINHLAVCVLSFTGSVEREQENTEK
jgi:hypothetical protein